MENVISELEGLGIFFLGVILGVVFTVCAIICIAIQEHEDDEYKKELEDNDELDDGGSAN